MQDTSHFSRMPRLLYDFKFSVNAYYDRKIDAIADSISRYFINYILEKPNSDHRIYLTKNYMSGENGLYRWNYDGRGKNYAHRPYSLSGTFYRGTWVFLQTVPIKQIYQDCIRLFPIERNEVYEVVPLYSQALIRLDGNDQKTVGQLDTPYLLSNGFSEMCCILSSFIK
jgi:hypothetical protein